jgi:hypothetical protein
MAGIVPDRTVMPPGAETTEHCSEVRRNLR